MLLISRRAGQGVMLGGRHILRFLSANGRQANMELTDLAVGRRRFFFGKLGEPMALVPGAFVQITELGRSRVKLGFDTRVRVERVACS